jgi:hypothetical protein
MNNGAGKGDKDRSTYTNEYKNNFDKIKWEKSEKSPIIKKNKKIYIYK